MRTRGVPGVSLLALLLGACAGDDSGPSLVLITLDTTRWDRIGVYGDPEARTPHLDALARTGLQARTARSLAATTLPAHATMMTGAHGLRHGVRLNGHFRLAAEAPTLAGILHARGYSTAAVISSAALASTFGLDRGFDTYDDTMPDTYGVYDPRWRIRARRVAGNQRRAAETVEATNRAIRSLGSPAFLWVHFIDAHAPYDPPPPWRRIPRLDLYDAEIAVVDRAMGSVLREAGDRWDRLVVAVVSDHGEGLGHHRHDGHGLFLYESILRVPLVLHGSGVPSRLITEDVHLADLAPTLVALTTGEDVSFPDGASLLGNLEDRDAVLAETLTPTLSPGGAPTKTVVLGRYKLVLAPRPEVYDLLEDPEESRDLHGVDPERDDRLRDALAAAVTGLTSSSYPKGDRIGLDPEQTEALEALGYVVTGGDVDPGEETASIGIDPKDFIDLYWALDYVSDGLLEAVRPRMERFWEEHPYREDPAWRGLYARAFYCDAVLDYVEGRLESAREKLERSRELDGGFEDSGILLEQLRRRETE